MMTMSRITVQGFLHLPVQVPVFESVQSLQVRVGRTRVRVVGVSYQDSTRSFTSLFSTGTGAGTGAGISTDNTGINAGTSPPASLVEELNKLTQEFLEIQG